MTSVVVLGLLQPSTLGEERLDNKSMLVDIQSPSKQSTTLYFFQVPKIYFSELKTHQVGSPTKRQEQ